MSFPVCAAVKILVVGTLKVLGTEVRGCRWDRGERAVADDPAKTATVTRPAATINANTLRLARLLISHRYYDHPAPPSHNPLGDSLLHRAVAVA